LGRTKLSHGFIDPAEIEELRNKISLDKSKLGKVYKAKRSEYYLKSVDHSLAEGMIEDGWEDYAAPLKTKTRLRRPKAHSVQFEDDMWCQLYDLGYRCFNVSNDFRLPYGKAEHEKKQIDVIAINDDSILLIECKSAEKSSKAPSYKTDLEGLKQRINGFTKTLEQMFGKGRKVKYIFATRNIRLSHSSVDVQRLEDARGFYFNDNAYEYVNSLIKTYKASAFYQFSAILFKGQSINKDKISVPAIEGRMGGKKYYMFSIEPEILLKLGFVLHRTAANEAEMPTYQRLLVPSRLKGIRKFIDDGGYFPNSVILNFNKKDKINFEATSKGDDSVSRNGTLKIPNTYAIAYIIDGQHRVYGYAGTQFKDSNTIPVVAFEGLAATEQLKIFMDINENQKAVSKTLRITLEEDLYWGSEVAASRIKALRSSVIQRLSGDAGPLFKKISIGEDAALLSANPFYTALSRSSLLPKVKGNVYDQELSKYSIYNIHNQNHEAEMQSARKNLVDFLNFCYEYAEADFPEIYEEKQGFVLSPRGTYAFISLISSLNEHEVGLMSISVTTKPEERFKAISKYLRILFEGLKRLPDEEVEQLKGKLGSGADTKWFRCFQLLVNEKCPKYNPGDLVDYKERQDEALQNEGRSLGVEIERFIKNTILSNLKELFDENWELEIAPTKRDCQKRASEEEERRYKEENVKVDIDWTEQFFITDYKKIIEKYWVREPEGAPEGFQKFENIFALDMGYGFNSKSEKLKWMSIFNSLRNLYAHEGSKEKGLNKDEVETLKKIHANLVLGDE
jgi:DNA sulfur modification protein DndB